MSKYGFNVDEHLEKAAKGEQLSEIAIRVICSKVKEVLSLEQNVVKVASPCTVVGDVHG